MRPATWLLLLLSIVVPARARAQVNAESLRPDPLRPGWSGGVDGSLALARGNIELLDLGGGARVQWQAVHAPAPADGTPPFVAQRAFLTVSGRFAEIGGKPFVSQAFAHARWTAMWHPRVGTDVFMQYQYNQFLRLQVRAVAGGGVRVEAVHRASLLVWGGAGYMIEYDRITVAPVAPDAPESVEHRLTTYLAARVALAGGRLLAQNTLYWQPRLDDPSDFRLLDEVEVLARVTTVLALGATLAVQHDAAPPTGVVPTDVRLVSSVKLSF